MQKSISGCTTRPTLKQMGYSCKRPQHVPLLSTRNEKPWLQFTGFKKADNRSLENIAWSDESRYLQGVRNKASRVFAHQIDGMVWVHLSFDTLEHYYCFVLTFLFCSDNLYPMRKHCSPDDSGVFPGDDAPHVVYGVQKRYGTCAMAIGITDVISAEHIGRI